MLDMLVVATPHSFALRVKESHSGLVWSTVAGGTAVRPGNEFFNFLTRLYRVTLRSNIHFTHSLEAESLL
jgi:hypothetical protein